MWARDDVLPAAEWASSVVGPVTEWLTNYTGLIDPNHVISRSSNNIVRNLYIYYIYFYWLVQVSNE